MHSNLQALKAPQLRTNTTAAAWQSPFLLVCVSAVRYAETCRALKVLLLR